MSRTNLLCAICMLLVAGLYSQEQSFSVSLIDDTLIKNANAVTRFDHTIVDQSNNNKITINKHVAITALNKKGAELVVFRESYKDGSDKIKDIDIKIYDKTGVLIREIGKKEIQDVAAYDGFSMITDYRVKYFEYETKDYPITVEWKFIHESKNTLFIPSWVPITTRGQSLELSTYKNGGDLNSHHELNLNHPNITKGVGNYSCKNLPAFTYEPLSPNIYNIVPQVLFSPKSFIFEGYKGTFNSWKELGQWRYDNFLKDRNNLIEEDVKQELDIILAGETDPETIARKIYDYVQETTRYINISLDEGGVRPMMSKDVHTKKYGDCKALSFYMKSLLKLYNIEANYVEIYASSKIIKSYMPEYCSATQGNHIILNIPLGQDTAWVDCTSNELPFNFLSDFTDDRLGLMVTENGGTLVKTPSYSNAKNSISTESVIQLNLDGNINTQTTIKSTGIPMNERLFLQDISDEDWVDKLQDRSFSHLKNLSLKSKQKELVEDEFQMIEDYSLSSTQYASIAGKYIIVPLALKKFSVPSLGKSKKRKYDINIKRSYTRTSTQLIEIPEDYVYTDEPLEETLKTEYGDYSLTLTSKDNVITIKRSMHIYKGNYPSDKFTEIRTFFNSIIKNEHLQFSIKKQQ